MKVSTAKRRCAKAGNETGGHMAAQLLTPRGEEPGETRSQASLDAATLSQVEFRTVRAIRQLWRGEPRWASCGNTIPPWALSMGLPSLDGAPAL